MFVAQVREKGGGELIWICLYVLAMRSEGSAFIFYGNFLVLYKCYNMFTSLHAFYLLQTFLIY